MTSYKFTTLLPLEFPTCPRALKSESEEELILGSSDLFVYFQKIIGVVQKGRNVLDAYFSYIFLCTFMK